MVSHKRILVRGAAKGRVQPKVAVLRTARPTALVKMKQPTCVFDLTILFPIGIDF